MLTADYWEQRYLAGGTSGDGSEGANAAFKAEFLNAFVDEHGIMSVAEYGCGDGRQLEQAEYTYYVGFDVAPAAVELCRERFKDDPSKVFVCPPCPSDAELVLSLDVIYHLIDDSDYDWHLVDVFWSATRFVILYTTDSDLRSYPLPAAHVRHRPVQADVAARFPGFRLEGFKQNPRPDLGGSDFYVYAVT